VINIPIFKTKNNELYLDGKVLKDCEWNKWGLVCNKHKMKDFEVYERYIEGDKISKTHQLFKPMVIMFYGKNEEDF